MNGTTAVATRLVFVGFRLAIIRTCQWRIQDFTEDGAPTPGGGREGGQHTI